MADCTILSLVFRPCLVAGMEKFFGLVAQRLTQEVVVELLHIGVVVRAAPQAGR